jgi:ATP-dependent DNA helicase RecQ
MGRVNAVIKAHRTDVQPFFFCSLFPLMKKYWMALLRAGTGKWLFVQRY